MDLPNAPHHGTVQWHHQHGGDQLEQLKMQKAFGIDFLDLLPAFNWTDFILFFNLLWSLPACSYDKRYFSPPLWMTQVRDAVSKSWWTETDVRQEERLSDYRKKIFPSSHPLLIFLCFHGFGRQTCLRKLLHFAFTHGERWLTEQAHAPV